MPQMPRAAPPGQAGDVSVGNDDVSGAIRIQLRSGQAFSSKNTTPREGNGPRLWTPWQMLRNVDDQVVDALLADAKTIGDKTVGTLLDTENAGEEAGDTLATAAMATDDKSVGALVDADTADGKAAGTLADPDTTDKALPPTQIPSPTTAELLPALLAATAAYDEEIAASADAKTAKMRSSKGAPPYSQALKTQ
jgi:hypothetical protein